MTYEVLGVGTPILDYLIEVDSNFIERIGGKKGGMEPIDADAFDAILKKCQNKPIIMPGGSCSNVIRGLASLGFSSALLGAIGNDQSNLIYSDLMKKAGIVPLFQQVNSPSAKVLSLVTPDGQRTCRTFLGASQLIDEKLITEKVFENVKLVHLEGYSLLQGSLTEHVMQLAKRQKAKVSLDLASFEIVKIHHKRVTNLLQEFVDIAFANEDEIEALTGLKGREGCLKLAELTDIAVVMQNKEGCFVGHKKNIFQVKPEPVKPLDTTGAGDLFSAGFLGAYLKGKTIKQCAELGNFLGGATVKVIGTDLSSSTWVRAKTLL
jgi:sugar/nucleoside kinase (ribokinase family)